MFSKILIANRGEIACRVGATARRLGIGTVAVFSDADADSLHVALADEALRIGPAPATESYLRIEAIVAAARRTGAEAIHPGYGFLSENAAFAEAVEAAGLVFIGPPASAIRAMGLKDAAKTLMAGAGVPVVPGYHGEDQDPDLLAAEADRIGYPILIKARAGGGGKGMRRVDEPAGFREALDSARREAAASFGDPACLVERYVARPRHIEFQVFADAHGNVVHLFERDCSLQRRHQKVIEEAPAPGMTAEVRAAMGRAAVEAARIIGYRGAGTVEFIVDGSGPPRADGFWFMEMNTRLQVEHPVSEAITGLDFVELQLSIAAGRPLPVRQEDLAIKGWAFEARLYAEDVPKGFLPATGTIRNICFPNSCHFGPGPVRVDSGVRAGDRITSWYDPMIAKLIVHGPDRLTALGRFASALAATRITGVVTNIALLAALARHPGFRRGDVDTGLIARDLETLLGPPAIPAAATALAALSAAGLLARLASTDPFAALTGWRAWSEAEDFVTLDAGSGPIDARIVHRGARHFCIEAIDLKYELSIVRSEGETVVVEADGHRVSAAVVREDRRITVFLDGRSHVFDVPDPADDGAEQAGGTGDRVHAPMPGLVTTVHVTAGATVSRGDPLLRLEAMKMEHVLTAPRDGLVAAILVEAGDQVSDGAVLLQLEPDHG